MLGHCFYVLFVNTFDVCVKALQLKVSKIENFALLLWSTVNLVKRGLKSKFGINP